MESEKLWSDIHYYNLLAVLYPLYVVAKNDKTIKELKLSPEYRSEGVNKALHRSVYRHINSQLHCMQLDLINHQKTA